MSDHVYKVEEIVGSSVDGIEEAIEGAIARAGKTIRNLAWFEVKEIRGHIDEGEVAHYQVKLKVGFTLDDGSAGR
jgi:flavin-binding protein dodecin